jgi:DNA-binding transcriptional regulator YiaG
MAKLPEYPSLKEITKARMAASLTQDEVAHLLHVTTWTVQYWEAGKRKIHRGLWDLLKIKIREMKS